MGTFLYGRRLYELMAGYWPTADRNPAAHPVEVEFAHIWKEKPKIVFSRTLDRVKWNARLVREVIADEIIRLKAEPGDELEVGGPTLAATFMRLGLIDEYRPIVHPVVLGCGYRTSRCWRRPSIYGSSKHARSVPEWCISATSA